MNAIIDARNAGKNKEVLKTHEYINYENLCGQFSSKHTSSLFLSEWESTLEYDEIFYFLKS